MTGIETVKEAVAEWSRAHPAPTRRELALLVKDLWARFRPELEAELAKFDDRALYPERPMMNVGTAEVSVWLLGWRKGDWTEIHDHEASEAAIHVLKGEVTERAYWPEAEASQRYSGPVQRVERELHQGSTVTVPTPYVHAVGNEVEATSATLHAYYPALAAMNYYEDVPGDGIKWKGRWIDDAP
jgi:quercetin dioxygenase-like cupin family protein